MAPRHAAGGGTPIGDVLPAGSPAPAAAGTTSPLLLSGRSRLLGGRRAAAVSATSTVVFCGLLVLALFVAPGAGSVRHYFFDLSEMRQALLGDPSKGLYSVGSAFLLNIEMFLVAEAIVLVLALVVAIVRMQQSPVFFPLRILATVYTDVMRGVPTLLVIYAIGFGIPALQLHGISTQSNAVYGVAALVLSYSAYVAEVYRAGLNSVPESQVAAARSLGLSQWRALRFVVLPQAVRTVVPPLLNDFISLQKDTALVSVLGTIETLRAAEIYGDTAFSYAGLTVAAILFLLITIPFARLTDRLIARDRARRLAGGTVSGGADPAHLVLRLRGVTKSFQRTPVLRGVDLDLAEHEVVCLIGASGSGKSTLLRCVNLLEPIDSGEIVLDGHDLSADGVDPDKVRRQIGIVFQAYNLFPHMSVLRNVTLAPVEVLGRPRAAAEEEGRALLTRFGLAAKADDYPDRLSGGQQQRVAMVRALAMQPRIMLLDEVTSALDPELVAEVLSVIRELATAGMTMLIATHEMGFARDIAHRVCFLEEGVIVEQAPPDELFAAPRDPRTQRFLRRIVEAGRL